MTQIQCERERLTKELLQIHERRIRRKEKEKGVCMVRKNTLRQLG